MASNPSWNRRDVLIGGSTAAVAGSLAASAVLLSSADAPAQAKPAALKGRIRHSAASWCFTSAGEKWTLDRLCEIAGGLGAKSVELLTPDKFPTLKKHGLTCAIASNTMPGGFRTGFSNPRYHAELVERTSKVIDECAEFGCPNVIAFTGFKFQDALDPKSGEIPRDRLFADCVAGIKKIAAYAEKKKVTVCLEHLNTRDDSHPMKGHPGYHGDDLNEVASIVRKVGSEYVKVLFDVYHVQIMHGDVIRRLEQCKDVLGHIHTAGNPGRGELDSTQEINYGPIMKKLVELKYGGFVGHEFIPTRDPRAGLAEAIQTCDV